MVFESVVVELLNRVLGDYVENLDTNQLQIGIWGGDVVLKNLVLKQNALEDLDLPIQTVYGQLGKLVLKIPWKNLYGAPVEAEIEGLYLLVVPNLEVKYNQEKEDRIFQENKKSELQRVENAKKKEAEKGQKKVDDSFVEKLTTQIIKNVQVKIRDIHIRYEDKVTNPLAPFSFGITLSNLSVQSTDDSWNKAIVSDVRSKIFKVLSLEALACYWNCATPLYSNMAIDDILIQFKEGIASKDMKPDKYLYMLGPINSSARLRMNPKPENDDVPFSIPKILLNLEMEKLAIGISKAQYYDIMLLAESMDRMKNGQPYRKYRPFLSSYRGHYREWWKFAYTCIMEGEIKRRRNNWNWIHIKQHRTLCRDYARSYQVKLKTKKVPADLLTQLNEYEKKLDVFNLIIIRQTIEMEVVRLERESEERAKNKSWFSSWWGTPATEVDQNMQTAADIMRKFEAAMTPDEKSKLFRAIDYQENSAPAEYPEEYVDTICAFLLGCLVIEVRDDSLDITRVLSAELCGVNCRLSQRPAASSIQVGVKINHFTVYGLQQGELLPNFVSSKFQSDGVPLLDLLFETNPLDKTCTQRVHLNCQPLKIIYDAQTVIKITDVFKTPQALAEQMQNVAGKQLAEFKEMSTTGIQYAVDRHAIIDLNINLSAPFIIMPYGGLYTGSETVLVINLGTVKLTTVARQKSHLNVRKMFQEGNAETDILKEVMSQSYEKFVCELTDVQVMIARENEQWEKCITENKISQMHLLQPMNLIVNIDKCLICDDPRLPKLKIIGELPSIMLNISDERLMDVLTLVNSIPFGNDNVEPAPLTKVASRSSNLSMFMHMDNKGLSKTKLENVKTADLVQSTELDMKFEMKELVVLICKTSNESDAANPYDKILKFHILNLELEMIQQTYNMEVNMRLGGIGLQQFRSKLTHNVISTPMTDGHEEYLFTVKYIQVNKKSPEFHSKYHSCEQRVVLDFSTLTLLFHQEAIEQLLQISSDFQARLEEVSKPLADVDHVSTASIAAPPQQLSAIYEGIVLSTKSTRTLSTAKPKSDKKMVVETISFKLNVDINKINILIANDARDIASLGIKGVKAEVMLKKSYTMILATLTDWTVMDANPLTKHTQILCVSGKDKALDAQIVIYNQDKSDVNSDAISVTVTMGCSRILFLNCFVAGMLDFLNKFQAAQAAIIEAASDAAEAAKQNMQDVYANATRILLNIKMKAPVIIVPTNSQSMDAVVLDLGYFELTNQFISHKVKNEMGNFAVIDDLKMSLCDFQLMRVFLSDQYKFIHDCTMLKPITFVLSIKRNLSTSWYTSVPDMDVTGEMKAIELNLSEADYGMVMQIMNENLAEGVPETKGKSGTKVAGETATTTVSVKPATLTVESHKVTSTDSKEITKDLSHTFLKFTFTMDSFIINLFKGGTKELSQLSSPVHSPKNGLAKFTLQVISVKGRILSDGGIITSILLVDCLLDDTRAGREGKLTRLMERKVELGDLDEVEESTTSPDALRSMIDITYQQKASEIFADVRIYSFNLILSMDYLMKIASFFTDVKTSTPVDPNKPKPVPTVKVSSTKNTASTTSRLTVKAADTKEEKKEPMMTLNVRIEKPDIILVERMDSIDMQALILNMEAVLSARMAGTNKTIRGSITDFQLYTCCYNPVKRRETKCPVLRPFSISVMGTTPEDQGLHLETVLTAVRLSVSPAIIDLLSRVSAAMSTSDVVSENLTKVLDNHSDIWDMKHFEEADHWFLKTELGEDVMEYTEEEILDSSSSTSLEKPLLKEVCCVSAPSFIITMEAGVGNKTLPMLLLETSFEAQVNDWSSKMSIDSSLTLQMAYYNSRLALWEPLIEPVEVIDVEGKISHTPWELKFEMVMNDVDEPSSVSSQTINPEPIEDVAIKPALISINVSSCVNLEVVVTKTCLEVISNLSKAFQSAAKEGVVAVSDELAPYKVVNDSGLELTIMLEESNFQLYSTCDIMREYKEIVLEKGANVPLQLKPCDEIDMSLNFGQEMSSSYGSALEEKILVINVNNMNCTLTLPVNRADKRYFSLNHRGESNDAWGIVSDIKVQGAETIVTLRSMLQVHNHFNQAVDVYYMTNRGNELEFIKKVSPGGHTNLPLSSVYTLTNELFFSVEGHSVTAEPFVWKDLQLNLSMSKVLQCPSVEQNIGEPFVMMVLGDLEQIYHENTTRHTMTSTCYNIHLRPAVTFKNYLPLPITCIMQGDISEVIVEPGERLHMPRINPGKSYVVLKIDYLEKEWSCRYEVMEKPPEFLVLQFDSYDSAAKVTLDLGLHCEDKKGTMHLALYCPFWMLNKTELMLSYRNSDENLNVMHHPAGFKGPILFSFNAKNFFGKKKASIRIKNGAWSDKFSLDVAGSSGVVVCRSDNVIYQIGVHNQLTYNNLTKQITFTPYFVLINNAPFAVECQELERPADSWVKVESESCASLWPRSEREDKLLKIRVVDAPHQISAPFLITEMHTTLLKLANQFGGINIDVQITEGAVYVTFTEYNLGLAPAIIINHTSEIISLWEKESVVIRKLDPFNRILFTWENPTGPRLLVWEIDKNKEIEDDLRKDGLGEFLTPSEVRIYWVSFLDGMQRILLFTTETSVAEDAQSAGGLENIGQEITISIHGMGLSFVNNLLGQEIMYIGIASTGVIWEASKLTTKRYKSLTSKECGLIEAAYQNYVTAEKHPIVLIDSKTEVDFKSGLLIKPNKRKLRRTFQTGLWIQMKTSPNQLQLHAKVNRLQIDNQMYDCVFPVVLAPVPPPKTVASDSAIKPFAELSIVQRIMKHSSVQQFKYFKVLIQEFHIKVDLGFINAISTLLATADLTDLEDTDLFKKDMKLVNEPLLAHVSMQSMQEQKNFYDLLHFSPLKIHISFSLASHHAAGLSESNTPAFLNVLLQGLGVTLTDMNDVVFRLAYFERDYTFLTQRQLISEATTHYVGQGVKQLYVLVLGLDVIGNPYGLVLGITKGVEDLFYEPFQGAIQGPGEFAEGLVLGVRSLFGHTVGGAAGAVSRITGAMGKGIAVLTFDKDYQRKRRDQFNKKPANLQEGIARGGKGLVMGVVDGVTGVFTKPVSGAKEQGVEGFFKGLGKGAIGLVTRPTAGVIDFASGSLDAVKRAAEMSDEVTRLRPPRFMHSDGLVRPYIKFEAEGHKLLMELEKGKYASTDVYSFHKWIIEEKDILLLTDKRLAYVVHNDIFGGWQVDWSYTWQELQMPVKVNERGVVIATGEQKKKKLSFFGSSDLGKLIIIGDVEQRELVRDKIEALRTNA